MDISYLVDAVSAASPQPIEGLVGQDVLRDQKAIVDLDKSILYLADPDALRRAPPCRRSRPRHARPARRSDSRLIRVHRPARQSGVPERRGTSRPLFIYRQTV